MFNVFQVRMTFYNIFFVCEYNKVHQMTKFTELNLQKQTASGWREKCPSNFVMLATLLEV